MRIGIWAHRGTMSFIKVATLLLSGDSTHYFLTVFCMCVLLHVTVTNGMIHFVIVLSLFHKWRGEKWLHDFSRVLELVGGKTGHCTTKICFLSQHPYQYFILLPLF